MKPTPEPLPQRKWLQVAVPVPLRLVFDYRMPAKKVCAGQRVVVPFGRRQLVGIAIGSLDETSWDEARIKDVICVLEDAPLSGELLELLSFAADYYQHPIGEVMTLALSPAFRKVPKTPKPRRAKPLPQSTQPDDVDGESGAVLIPTNSQTTAHERISQTLGSYQCWLLAGPTGSGKTEVYVKLVQSCFERFEQVLLLVPEIGLTPAFCARFEAHFFGRVGVIHSGLTEARRRDQWLALSEGKVDLLLGTRAALFTPMPRLGLIIVDEEQDSAYKQPTEFCYSARDLAIKRASICQIPVVLGSATPSLETLANVERGLYKSVQLKGAPGAKIRQPRWSLVDLSTEKAHTLLAGSTIKTMHKHLAEGHQVLLFVNRRGHTPALFCPSCRWTLGCPHCDARMVLHVTQLNPNRAANHSRAAGDFALCHHCGVRQNPNTHCPTCHAETLIGLGAGTQQLADLAAETFAPYEVLRFDTDVQGKQRMKLFDSIKSGRRQILVGTQMLAKGHDLKNLTLTVIADADAGLMSADFRSTERMAQLIIQVMGRAGRHLPGEALIQTRLPNHPMLQQLLKQGYPAFAQTLLQERKQSHLPPYAHLVLFRAEAKSETSAIQLLKSGAALARAECNNEVEVWGPAPMPMRRKGGLYRQQLVLCASKRHEFRAPTAKLITHFEQNNHKQIRWFVEVDPQQV